jgi:DNA-binding MarR family transcriptional regulator
VNKTSRPEAPARPSPEGPPGGSVVFLLSSLGVAASQGFRDALAPLGLEPRQFGVLNLVASAEGISQRELSEPLGIPASRLVAIVDGLEDQGLVERRRNAEDRRAYALHLTAKGRQALGRARGVSAENENRFAAPLKPKEREQLLDLLRRLAAGHELQSGVHPGLAARDVDLALGRARR